jgi:aminoglycoside 3-N-acetyltransferase
MVPPADAPEVTRGDIVAGLRRLGLSAGAGVMVHSSLKSFGRVAGGPGTVIEALMEVITPEGTLMMPSFNHGRAFGEGAAGYFDPRTTPTTNGAIPDAFWRMPDVCRSLHPTHAFAAWGRSARRYTRFHHRTLTCGPDSPLGLVGREGGYGLLLGVDYRVNTFHHVVEVSTGAPCLGRRTESLPMLLPDGRRVDGRTWSWREKGCPITDGTRYGPLMAARGLQTEAVIGACRAICFRLRDCFALIAELLRTGTGGFPPCSRCAIRPRRGPRTVPSDWDERKQCLKPDSPALDY